MGRTWLSVITAAVLTASSLGVFVARRCTQGAEPGARLGDASWNVTLVAAGTLGAQETSITLVLPPAFRHQHIFDERFQSKELLHRAVKSKDPSHREVAWKRASTTGNQPVRFTYAFRCVTGVRQPTAAMVHHTRLIDAVPIEDTAIKPSAGVESAHQEIVQAGKQAVGTAQSAVERARALFDYVARVENEPSLDSPSALECLRAGSGNAGSKSRLLVALCRSQGIPARLVSGLILAGDQEQGLHHWAEAWVDHEWLPMCPTYQHFGRRVFPKNYLIVTLGDSGLFRGAQVPLKHGFLVQAFEDSTAEGSAQHSIWQKLWWRLSLYRLRPADQHVVRFLLLLPLAALIVSVLRTVIGVFTYGAFAPALLGLAFLDLRALHWGLVIFVATVLVGWAMRHMLDRFHLLMVPRTVALLTLIVSFLLILIVLAGHYGISGTLYISLFPLVILTHMVERFWTVEVEDGAAASFKTLLGTLLVAVAVSMALSPAAVSQWMFRYPETLGIVLAAELLIGRYTGYRLTELYRFDELLRNGNPPGGST